MAPNLGAGEPVLALVLGAGELFDAGVAFVC